MAAKTKTPTSVQISLIDINSVEVDGAPSGTVVDVLANLGKTPGIREGLLDALNDWQTRTLAASEEDQKKRDDDFNVRVQEIRKEDRSAIRELAAALDLEKRERANDAEKFYGLVAAVAEIPTDRRSDKLSAALAEATTTLVDKTRAALEAQIATAKKRLSALPGK